MHVSQDPDAYFAGSDLDLQMTQLLDEKMIYGFFLKFSNSEGSCFVSWNMTILSNCQAEMCHKPTRHNMN